MPLIAVNDCQFQDNTGGGQVTILSGLSQHTKACGKPICLDGLQVQVVGGQLPGGYAQVNPVTVTINAQIIQHDKVEGKCPLAVNEISSGQEMGTYSNGQSSTQAPVIVQITDAGQQFVKAQ